jgi:hypothetical protein
MTERIFSHCVDLLNRTAKKLGISYEAINVWLFCVIVPAVIVGQTVLIFWLLCR